MTPPTITPRFVLELAVHSALPRGTTMTIPISFSIPFMVNGTREVHRATGHGLFTPTRDLWPGDKVRLESAPLVEIRESANGPTRLACSIPGGIVLTEVYAPESVKKISYDDKDRITEIVESK